MSRVGKSPVQIPSGVECHLSDGVIRAKGKLGELDLKLSSEVEVKIEDGKITVAPRSASGRSQGMWGTTRRLIGNLVEGVDQGFTKKLEINGVGYRASVQGSKLVLQLGYSHNIEYPIPEDLTIKCEKNLVSITGKERQRVGQIASEIRSFRKPEPYKGKGIKYEGERILRKEGKKK